MTTWSLAPPKEALHHQPFGATSHLPYACSENGVNSCDTDCLFVWSLRDRQPSVTVNLTPACGWGERYSTVPGCERAGLGSDRRHHAVCRTAAARMDLAGPPLP